MMNEETHVCGCRSCRSSLGKVYAFWLAVLTAVALWAFSGCTLAQPLTPVQREQQARQRAAQGVLYCDVFAGRRTCKRVDRQEIERVLRGGL